MTLSKAQQITVEREPVFAQRIEGPDPDYWCVWAGQWRYCVADGVPRWRAILAVRFIRWLQCGERR